MFTCTELEGSVYLLVLCVPICPLSYGIKFNFCQLMTNHEPSLGTHQTHMIINHLHKDFLNILLMMSTAFPATPLPPPPLPSSSTNLPLPLSTLSQTAKHHCPCTHTHGRQVFKHHSLYSWQVSTKVEQHKRVYTHAPRHTHITTGVKRRTHTHHYWCKTQDTHTSLLV